MSKTIVVNGKTYTVTKDSFGCTLVNGVPVAKFVTQMSTEDQAAVAAIGLQKAHTNPQWFEDAAERVELPEDIRQTIRNIITNVDT